MELLKKFPTFYGTRNFMALFKRVSRLVLILMQMNSVHVLTKCFFKIYFNLIFPSTPSSYKLSLFHVYRLMCCMNFHPQCMLRVIRTSITRYHSYRSENRKVSGSNLDGRYANLTDIFRRFRQSLHKNARIVLRTFHDSFLLHTSP